MRIIYLSASPNLGGGGPLYNLPSPRPHLHSDQDGCIFLGLRMPLTINQPSSGRRSRPTRSVTPTPCRSSRGSWPNSRMLLKAAWLGLKNPNIYLRELEHREFSILRCLQALMDSEKRASDELHVSMQAAIASLGFTIKSKKKPSRNFLFYHSSWSIEMMCNRNLISASFFTLRRVSWRCEPSPWVLGHALASNRGSLATQVTEIVTL
jgi:hypothetical protein